jgi:hypothetical protein
MCDFLGNRNAETNKSFQTARSDFHTVVLMKIKVFWHITLCRTIKSWRRVTALICLVCPILNTEAQGSWEMSVVFTIGHDITPQKTQTFVQINNQIDAQFIPLSLSLHTYIYIYLFVYLFIYFDSLPVSSNLVLIIRRVNCFNTTSGICHSV